MTSFLQAFFSFPTHSLLLHDVSSLSGPDLLFLGLCRCWIYSCWVWSTICIPQTLLSCPACLSFLLVPKDRMKCYSVCHIVLPPTCSCSWNFSHPDGGLRLQILLLVWHLQLLCCSQRVQLASLIFSSQTTSGNHVGTSWMQPGEKIW